MTTRKIEQYLQAMQPQLVSLRRRLHQIPEVGLQLPQTQQVILDEIADLGLEITTGRQVSSVTAVLRGKAAIAEGTRRPVILLRGDMDALPVVEQTGLDFASTNGAMHACGHDLHMTFVVAAAKALAAHADELVADVVFMFQPGEEGCSGAKYMIEEGVLDAAGQRVDQAYAIHVFSAFTEHARFATRAGTIMAASDDLRVRVNGRGGHGSAPHSAADPVPATCEMVLAAQTLITRHFDVFDPAVISVGVLSAGKALNVIPASAHFEATLRTFSQKAQDKLFSLLPPMINGIAAAHGVSAEIDLQRLYPPTVNEYSCYQRLTSTARELFGDERMLIWDNPLTGAEDFSFVLQQVPGCFVALSAVPPNADPQTSAYNHSPLAVFDDSVLADGATLLATLASTAPPIELKA